MSLIDSFWSTPADDRDNPRKRPKHGLHRASRGGAADEAAFVAAMKTRRLPPKVVEETPAAEERWSRRVSHEAPHGERGFMPVKASGGRTSAMEWAQKHKYKAVAGVAAGSALIAYLMKPAQATVVTPAVVQVNPVLDDGSLGKALGVGAFVALAAGVALYASEN